MLPADRLAAVERHMDVLESALLRHDRILSRLGRCVKALWVALTLALGLLFALAWGGMAYLLFAQVYHM